jgi:1,4-dihydroxy-2-naphthoate octaprenyltransferase
MKGKMKDCFTPHIYMHSLFGLGLGLVLADIWGDLAKWWIGLILIVVAVLLDMMRKH